MRGGCDGCLNGGKEVYGGGYKFLRRQAMMRNVPFENLSTKRKANYLAYVAKIEKDITADAAGQIAVIELDRKSVGWSQQLSYDACISLRVKGPELFIMSIYDWQKDPMLRDYHGWLPEQARFPLQGHDPRYRNSFTSQNASRAASGNAYAVPMLAAHLIPLVTRAVQAGILTNPRKRPLTRDELLSLASRREQRRRLDA